jgi:hypothetical protein
MAGRLDLGVSESQGAHHRGFSNLDSTVDHGQLSASSVLYYASTDPWHLTGVTRMTYGQAK